MVPSYELYSFRIPKFQAREEGDCFDGMQTAVYIVACQVSYPSDACLMVVS